MGSCLLLKSALDQYILMLDSSLKGKVLLRTVDHSAFNYQWDSNAALPEVLGRARVCCDRLLYCGILVFIYFTWPLDEALE